jgi:hypothetical protein
MFKFYEKVPPVNSEVLVHLKNNGDRIRYVDENQMGVLTKE